MSDNVVFEDFSVNVKNAIKEKAISFLHEAGGELRSQTERNSRRDTGETAGSYKYVVDEGQLAVHVGSNHKNAIWEEFGTGIHALKGNGRKGWWVYVKGGSSSKKSSKSKSYSSPKQAEMAVQYLKEKGLDAHMTRGKTANRPLFKAFTSSKSAIIARAEQIFGGLNT